MRPHRLVFRSKRDLWLTSAVGLSAAGLLASAITALLSGPLSPPIILAVLGSLGGVGLCLGALNTHYVLDVHALRIVSAPFGWTVPYAELRSVTPSSSPLSSPALSLDRLELAYTRGGRRRHVLISPDDRGAFIEELARRAPQAEIVRAA